MAYRLCPDSRLLENGITSLMLLFNLNLWRTKGLLTLVLILRWCKLISFIDGQAAIKDIAANLMISSIVQEYMNFLEKLRSGRKVHIY